MSGDISLFDVSRHFYVSAQHPSPPDATPPKKTNTIKKKHRVHLALLHVKHANNNLRESPLTSLLIVNQEHVYRYEKKKKKKGQLLSAQKNSKTLSAFRPGGKSITQPHAILFSTMRKLSPCLAFELQTHIQTPWGLFVMKSGCCGWGKKEGKKEEKNLPKKWECSLSLLMALSSICTAFVFTKDPAVFCLF